MMPVMRYDFGNGMVVESPVSIADVPRIQNAIRLPDVKIATWDKMTKRERERIVADYEWFSQYLTRAKLDNRKYATPTMVGQTLGYMKGNGAR